MPDPPHSGRHAGRDRERAREHAVSEQGTRDSSPSPATSAQAADKPPLTWGGQHCAFNQRRLTRHFDPHLTGAGGGSSPPAADVEAHTPTAIF